MATNINITSCQRCGTCCLKGGPALHVEDRTLVVEGLLRPEHLVTLRTGELVFHPVQGGLMELPFELIKIRGAGPSWACLFYGEEDQGCSIYAHRPVECRALRCWDTAEVEALFLRGLLSRGDLCPGNSVLAEVIEEHERRYPVEKLGAEKDARALARLVELEEAFRQGVCEALGLAESGLEFFLGRSLGEVLRALQAANRDA